MAESFKKSHFLSDPKKKTDRPLQINKRVVVVISLAALILLAVSVLMGLWSERAMQETVAGQFNDEQLIIAGHIAQLIEKELHRLEKEMILAGAVIAEQSMASPVVAETARLSFARVQESGVKKIEIIDLETHRNLIFMPYRHWWEDGTDTCIKDNFPLLDMDNHRMVWVSSPLIKTSGLRLLMALPLAGNSRRLLVFHINLAWFLNPFINTIRSGDTGYAWLMDQNGFFLFHPKSGFIGKDAFTIRKKADARFFYRSINYIQKEMMLKGGKGTGLYTSGWHRGITGEVQKLIAYHPVDVSLNPPQKWSVAVVAPVSEIETAVRNGYRRQILLQGLVLLVILLGGGGILFFEMRWSAILEQRVSQRTDELKRSEGKYRSLVESAEDFIFTVDPKGHFLSMNTFTANFFGGRPEEFVGRHLSGLMHGQASTKQLKLVNMVCRLGKSVRGEIEIRTGENRVWLNSNFMPIKDKNGEINTILCIARDITENKNLERQLVNAEKLASLGTLAAGVAHEINNPLGVILGFSDLLIRKKAKGSQEYEDLKTIERQGMHCKQVVENLLSFARIGKDITEYSDLNQCIGEIIKVVKHSLEMKQIELKVDLAEKLPMVRGDTRQLQQVFLNLINNAMGAMPHAGCLTIKTSQTRERVVVAFTDTGQGIKGKDMDHIYEPFFTTKPEGEGTGLGLFVSYGIVNKFGGVIHCVSQVAHGPGESGGTTFTVKLVKLKQE